MTKTMASQPDPAQIHASALVIDTHADTPQRFVDEAWDFTGPLAVGDQPGGGSEVLVCQRRPDQPMSLKWEFPGGKIEPGETSEQALARELSEELDINATIASPR